MSVSIERRMALRARSAAANNDTSLTITDMAVRVLHWTGDQIASGAATIVDTTEVCLLQAVETWKEAEVRKPISFKR